MAGTWVLIDAGNNFTTSAIFGVGENSYIHNDNSSSTSIVPGTLVFLLLNTWTAAGTVRTFTVTGANGLTFTRKASFVSGDGKTRTELWYSISTVTIAAGFASGQRVALATSSITEDVAQIACDIVVGLADPAGFVASMVEGDYVNLGTVILRGQTAEGRVDISWEDIESVRFQR